MRDWKAGREKVQNDTRLDTVLGTTKDLLPSPQTVPRGVKMLARGPKWYNAPRRGAWGSAGRLGGDFRDQWVPSGSLSGPSEGQMEAK